MNVRWLPFFITAYVCLGFQVGCGAYTQFKGVSPNLMLILVVFFALNAPRESALLAGIMLGLFQDLTTVQPLGVFAFSYGIVAAVVAWSAEFVRRGHPLTHLSLTLLGGVITALVVLGCQWVHHAGPAEIRSGVARIGPRVLIVSAIYSSALSPLLIAALQRFQRQFGFDLSRRRNRV